jgi:hypothetical protein
MTQEITVTKVEDHYEMQFDGGTAYPAPTNAIDSLDDALTPEEVGESVTIRGDYGGHKHAKTFDVDEVIATPGDDEKDQADDEDVETVPTAEVPPEVPYTPETAGVAQQINARNIADPEKRVEAETTDANTDSDSDAERYTPTLDEFAAVETGDTIGFSSTETYKKYGMDKTCDVARVIESGDSVRIEYMDLKNYTGALTATATDSGINVTFERGTYGPDGLEWSNHDAELTAFAHRGPSDRPRVVPDAIKDDDPELPDSKWWRLARRVRGLEVPQ